MDNITIHMVELVFHGDGTLENHVFLDAVAANRKFQELVSNQISGTSVVLRFVPVGKDAMADDIVTMSSEWEYPEKKAKIVWSR